MDDGKTIREEIENVAKAIDYEAAIIAVRSYMPNEQMAFDAVGHIASLPQIPRTDSEREAFKMYASALQSFIMFGVDDPSWAAALVQLCVRIEGALPGYWNERERVICRVLATGRLGKDDWVILGRSGVLLPLAEDPRGATYTGPELVKAIDESTPKAPWETDPDDGSNTIDSRVGYGGMP